MITSQVVLKLVCSCIELRVKCHGSALFPVWDCSFAALRFCGTPGDPPQTTCSVSQAVRERKRCVTAHWLNSVLKRKRMLPPHRALHFPVAFPPGGKPCSQHVRPPPGPAPSRRPPHARTPVPGSSVSDTVHVPKHAPALSPRWPLSGRTLLTVERSPPKSSQDWSVRGAKTGSCSVPRRLPHHPGGGRSVSA